MLLKLLFKAIFNGFKYFKVLYKIVIKKITSDRLYIYHSVDIMFCLVFLS